MNVSQFSQKQNQSIMANPFFRFRSFAEIGDDFDREFYNGAVLQSKKEIERLVLSAETPDNEWAAEEIYGLCAELGTLAHSEDIEPESLINRANAAFAEAARLYCAMTL